MDGVQMWLFLSDNANLRILSQTCALHESLALHKLQTHTLPLRMCRRTVHVQTTLTSQTNTKRTKSTAVLLGSMYLETEFVRSSSWLQQSRTTKTWTEQGRENGSVKTDLCKDNRGDEDLQSLWPASSDVSPGNLLLLHCGHCLWDWTFPHGSRKQQTNVCTNQHHARVRTLSACHPVYRPARRSRVLKMRMCVYTPVGCSGSLSAVETCNKDKRHKNTIVVGAHLTSHPANLNRVYTCSPHLRTLWIVVLESFNAGHQICLGNGFHRACPSIFAWHSLIDSAWMKIRASLVIFGLLASFCLVSRRTQERSPFHPCELSGIDRARLHGPICFPQQLSSVHDHGRLRSSWEPQLLPFHLNFYRFHQPCLLPWRNTLLPPKHWFLGKDRWSPPSPYHVATTYPCGQPGSPSFASHWRCCHAD